MGIAPSTRRRERILMYAPDKVGKTNSWLSILSMTDDDVKFWVADSDLAFWPNIEEFPNVNTDRVHLYDELYSWQDWVKFAEDAIEGAGENDWIIIDRVDILREAAQAYWTEEVEGSEVGAWYVQKSKELKAVNERRSRDRGERGINTEINWQFINNIYYQYLNRINLRARTAHLFMASSAKDVITEGGWADSKRTLAKFGDAGMKPGGGSGLPAIPSTILFLYQYGGRRELTTIGDRGRERKNKLNRQRFNDFCTSYLIPVGKWRVVGGGNSGTDDTGKDNTGKDDTSTDDTGNDA